MDVFKILQLLLTLSPIVFAVNDICPPNIPKNEFLVQHGGFCYEFVINRKAQWDDAKKDCESKGGYLTDIHSYAEQGHLTHDAQLVHPDDKGLWIGLTDKGHEGNWTWVSGLATRFKNWASGQPGVIGGLENCALMEFSASGLWHDYPCAGIFGSETHGWICKYDLLA